MGRDGMGCEWSCTVWTSDRDAFDVFACDRGSSGTGGVYNDPWWRWSAWEYQKYNLWRSKCPKRCNRKSSRKSHSKRNKTPPLPRLRFRWSTGPILGVCSDPDSTPFPESPVVGSRPSDTPTRFHHLPGPSVWSQLGRR